MQPIDPTPLHDPRLGPWLAAADGPDADRVLARLLEEAGPVFAGIMHRKFGGVSRHGPDAEDVVGEARLQIVRRLQRLRAPAPGEPEPPLTNFQAYAATVTYTAWAGHLRRRHPARAMLLNRVRYLFEGRAGPQGFALWQGAGGEMLAGFAVWREQGRVPAPTPRARWLLVDPPAAAADAFGAADAVPSDLAALAAGLLAWLDGPLELRELVRALAELLGLHPAPEPSADAVEEAAATLVDPGASPLETLRWKEYLAWLWREVAALPPRQRAAFLLHGSVLREMELLGLSSVRAAAAALELAPEHMAELWPRLPLDDLAIAALLGGSRQQIINLRKGARTALGKAWQKFLPE